MIKFKNLLITGLSFLFIFSFFATSQAYLQKVHFDVQTTNYTDDQQLNVWIGIEDTVSKNPPDDIESISVTAPDGTVFTMTTANNWLQYDRGYWQSYHAEDFNTDVIPGGEYKVLIKGKKFSLEIEETDTVDATFLEVPTITSPTDGSSVGRTPLIEWTAVPGATHYRILIWDEYSNEPVYWFWRRRFYTDHNVCLLPLGDLRPDGYYRLRVEARAGSQDLDKRSRSDWIYFYTNHWE